MIVPSRLPKRATPAVTCRYWPRSCECQAVRAPGAKRTLATTARCSGPCGAAIRSTHTLPANCSGGFLMVSRAGSMFMCLFLLEGNGFGMRPGQDKEPEQGQQRASDHEQGHGHRRVLTAQASDRRHNACGGPLDESQDGGTG